MALPTKAQWTSEIAILNQLPDLGLLYLDAAPIFTALGLPLYTKNGETKVKWSSGSTAASDSTGAGATSSGAPAQVVKTFKPGIAAIASQAYSDIGVDIMGDGYEEQASMNAAVASLYDEFVKQLVASSAGENYDIWGLGNFNAQSGVPTALSGSTDTSLGLELIREAHIKLPRTGYTIALCSDEAYTHIEKLIEDKGGTTPIHTSLRDFGFETLKYKGIFFFNTRHITTTNQLSSVWLINIGPSGTGLVFPTGQMFRVDGPKKTKGEFNTVWDIALTTQVVYQSPNSAIKIANFITP